MKPPDAIDINSQMAERFIARLKKVEKGSFSTMRIPDTTTGVYLSAILGAADAIATAGRGEHGATVRMRNYLGRADAAINNLSLPPAIEELARNAVRGILVHSLANQGYVIGPLYAPFEPYIELVGLRSTAPASKRSLR